MEHVPSTPSDGALGESVNRLGFDLFRELWTRDNLAFSPVGVHAILSLLCAGASGSTRELLERVVGCDPTGSLLCEAFDDIAKQKPVGDDKAPDVSMANSAWIQERYPIKPEYIDAVKVAARATVTPVDFAGKPDKACRAVNKWVDKHTKGRIRDVISPQNLDPLLRMILVNAVYFKARWLKRFPYAFPGEFYPSDGEVMTASMMVNELGQLPYYDDDSVVALMLPYNVPTLSLLVVMPHTKEVTIDGEAFQRIWRELEASDGNGGHRVQLRMPEFRFEGRMSLASTLGAIGLEGALGPGSDYTAIADVEPVYPDEIMQNTWVNVDKTGTEAAAVTLSMMVGAGGPFEIPLEVNIDRPFLWAIVERRLGAALFMGWTERPNVEPHEDEEEKELKGRLGPRAEPPPGEISVDGRYIPRTGHKPILEIIVEAEDPGEASVRATGRGVEREVANAYADSQRPGLRLGPWQLRKPRHPAGVLLNLDGMDHRLADVLGSAWTLGIGSRETRLAIASCVYASGEKKKALERHFEPGTIGPQLCMRLFDDRDQAIRYLEEQLADRQR